MAQRKTYRAYAKINLLLDVTGRLPSGYHTVAMVMQSVSLCDIVTVETADEPGIAVVCGAPGIPAGEDNICHRACAVFGAGRELPGLRVTLEKHIPCAAGLAGGSADAAAVLTALRDLFAPDMPDEELAKRGLRVGADVPFCLRGGCCLAEGTGERLTPLPGLPESYRVALLWPPVPVSTREAYAALDHLPLRRPDVARAVRLIRQGSWERAFALCGNVFERAANLPGLEQLKAEARARGAALCQMTGSGAAVFAVYPAALEAGPLHAAMRAAYDVPLAEALRPVNCGVAAL